MPFKKVTQNRQFYYVGPEPQAFETLPDPSCTRYIAATLSHIALSLTRLARDGERMVIGLGACVRASGLWDDCW